MLCFDNESNLKFGGAERTNALAGTVRLATRDATLPSSRYQDPQESLTQAATENVAYSNSLLTDTLSVAAAYSRESVAAKLSLGLRLIAAELRWRPAAGRPAETG